MDTPFPNDSCFSCTGSPSFLDILDESNKLRIIELDIIGKVEDRMIVAWSASSTRSVSERDHWDFALLLQCCDINLMRLDIISLDKVGQNG